MFARVQRSKQRLPSNKIAAARSVEIEKKRFSIALNELVEHELVHLSGNDLIIPAAEDALKRMKRTIRPSYRQAPRRQRKAKSNSTTAMPDDVGEILVEESTKPEPAQQHAAAQAPAPAATPALGLAHRPRTDLSSEISDHQKTHLDSRQQSRGTPTFHQYHPPLEQDTARASSADTLGLRFKSVGQGASPRRGAVDHSFDDGDGIPKRGSATEEATFSQILDRAESLGLFKKQLEFLVNKYEPSNPCDYLITICIQQLSDRVPHLQEGHKQTIRAVLLGNGSDPGLGKLYAALMANEPGPVPVASSLLTLKEAIANDWRMRVRQMLPLTSGSQISESSKGAA